MLRLTLDQMRSSIGRLAAAGIAIVLGTAFVAASLLATATMQQATYDSMTAGFGDADLIVENTTEPLTLDAVDVIRGIDGVAAADALGSVGLEVTGPDGTEYVSAGPTPSAESLAVGSLQEGRDVAAESEIVLPAAVAERIGVAVGDSVETLSTNASGETQSMSLQLVGLLAETDSFFTSASGARIAESLFATTLEQQQPAGSVWISVMASLEDGADAAAVIQAIEANPDLGTASVLTMDELADMQMEATAGSTVVFLVLMLGFAAVALSVAGLVIANTFQVLVAQRTRTLALLRCVGASRAQIRRSVLLEAALLGVGASTVGLLLGTVVVTGGLAVLAQVFPQAALATSVPFSPWVPVVTLGIGIVVTTLAALVPARNATAVAPIAALRPLEGATEPRANRGRLAFSLVAVALGAAMLVGGVALGLVAGSTDAQPLAVLAGLALGVFGGIVSLVGLLVGSVFLVPKLIGALGRIAGSGVPARIATANAVRNPRRTAATTNALVIGVALVVMMSTGALSARQTLDATLDAEFPVDVTAMSVDPGTAVQPEQRAAIAATSGVAATLLTRMDYDTSIVVNGAQAYAPIVAVVDGDAASVLRDPSLMTALSDDTIVVDPESELAALGSEGSSVEVLNQGSPTTLSLTLAYANTGAPDLAVVSAATMQRISGSVEPNAVWARFADDANPAAVAGELQQTVNELSQADPAAPVLQLGGSAVQRAAFSEVIDTLLAIVLGLLAVAVVIALVGVANTLSLSVIERRRENATLRAIGLTRGQLRGMLAVEGVLIAVVGTVVGVAAGLLYGWAGSAIVLGGVGGGEGLLLGVPWMQLLAVAAIAVLAGLLASVLPARSAVRQSPVAALATD